MAVSYHVSLAINACDFERIPHEQWAVSNYPNCRKTPSVGATRRNSSQTPQKRRIATTRLCRTYRKYVPLIFIFKGAFDSATELYRNVRTPWAGILAPDQKYAGRSHADRFLHRGVPSHNHGLLRPSARALAKLRNSTCLTLAMAAVGQAITAAHRQVDPVACPRHSPAHACHRGITRTGQGIAPQTKITHCSYETTVGLCVLRGCGGTPVSMFTPPGSAREGRAEPPSPSRGGYASGEA
jgi:hypothetical protein